LAKLKTTRWHVCNVLQTRGGKRQFWQFEHEGNGVALAGSRATEVGEPIPGRWAIKSWQHLWQPKLNVAWLPASRVFLRVVHLPYDPELPSESGEVRAMVEFQIERLSPLPLAQAVWAIEPLAPSLGSKTQTVVVIIAPRDLVEEYLGDLEGAGYLADRLEFPQLWELTASRLEEDGVWICPWAEEEKTLCLVAWWCNGQLQDINLLTLAPGTDGGLQLTRALRQVAWAGECEEWLAPDLCWRLVSDPETAAALEPALKEFSGAPIELRDPLPPDKLAALSAGSGTIMNLVPEESAVRYRQQFIDRLWMRGLAAVGMVYLLGVLGYMGALKVMEFKKGRVDNEVAALTAQYNNALQLKARVQVLQDQVNLKYAALDSWKVTSEALPEEMTLSSLAFQRGRKLVLFGSVPSEQQTKVADFNEALSKATANGQLLFTNVTTRSIQAPSPGQGSRPASWSIDCELKRVEVE